MENVLGAIKSLEWWFTVVVAGLVINLIAGYLKTALDSKLSKISTNWAEKSEKRKVEKLKYIESISNDEKLFTLNSTKHVSSIKNLLIWLVLSTSIFTMSKLVSYNTISIIMTILSFFSFYQAIGFMYKSSYYLDCAEASVKIKSDQQK